MSSWIQMTSATPPALRTARATTSAKMTSPAEPMWGAPEMEVPEQMT